VKVASATSENPVPAGASVRSGIELRCATHGANHASTVFQWWRGLNAAEELVSAEQQVRNVKQHEQDQERRDENRRGEE